MLWMSCLPAAALLLLLLLPCSPGQKCEGNGQQTDIISVWEGDSISITCSRKYLEEVGTYLKTSKDRVNVLFVSRQGTSRIHSTLVNRLNYSEEGRNLRITLHNAQQSDSNIYQCSTYVKTEGQGHHKELCEKEIIVVVKARTGALEQSPLYASPQPSQSINITCALKSPYEEFYLLKTHVHRERVLCVSSQNTSTTSLAFANRLEYSNEEKKIVITLHNLQENDSDIYVCAGLVKKVPYFLVSGSGTMMLIKGTQIDCRNSFWIICALAIMVALLLTALMCCALSRVDV
ncbi:CD7 protein, partial [Psilopogon haemacephalus]|nr:CD7 protein [Psilopogon haemacephalus]